MDEKMKKAIDVVFEKLLAMPRTQFLNELEQRGNGDIASILLYTGAFEVRETEAMGFVYSTPGVYVVPPLPKGKSGIVDQHTPILSRFVHAVTFSSTSEIKSDSATSYSNDRSVQISLLNDSALYSAQNKDMPKAA